MAHGRVGGATVANPAARLLFEAPAEAFTTTVDRELHFRGCFRVWWQADRGAYATLHCDPDEHPLLAPDGLLFKMVARGPVATIEGNAIEVDDFLAGRILIRFHTDAQAHAAARAWTENL